MKPRRFARLFQLSALIALSGILAPAAKSAIVTIPPSKDNTLFEDAAGNLSDGQGDHFYVGKTGETNGFKLRRGLIAFDVSSVIPPGAIISDASLSMFLSKSAPGSGSVNVSLHLATRDWGEGASDSDPLGGGGGIQAQVGDATWIHNFYNSSTWAVAGGEFRGTSSATTTVNIVNRTSLWNSGTLTADVQEWVNNPGTNFGWFVRGDEVNAQSAQRFSSGESLSNTPQLTITFTIPEPSSALLCGAAGLLVARRRRVPIAFR